MREKIKKIINVSKRHWLGILLALLVGIVTISPNLIFIMKLGDEYKGLYIMKADAHPYYISRIKEMYEGNGMTNPYIYEYKFNTLPATPIFGAYPIAIVGKILGVKAENIALMSTFVIPILVALLVYSFGFLLTKRPLFALLLSGLIMFGTILFNMEDLLHLFRGELVYTQLTIWTRPILPTISFLVFFLYLNVLYKALETKSNKWFGVLALVYGLSFYTYLYCFLFLSLFV